MHGLIAELHYFLLQATTVREGVAALKVRDVNLFAFVFVSYFVFILTSNLTDQVCLITTDRRYYCPAGSPLSVARLIFRGTSC